MGRKFTRNFLNSLGQVSSKNSMPSPSLPKANRMGLGPQILLWSSRRCFLEVTLYLGPFGVLKLIKSLSFFRSDVLPRPSNVRSFSQNFCNLTIFQSWDPLIVFWKLSSRTYYIQVHTQVYFIFTLQIWEQEVWIDLKSLK